MDISVFIQYFLSFLMNTWSMHMLYNLCEFFCAGLSHLVIHVVARPAFVVLSMIARCPQQ